MTPTTNNVLVFPRGIFDIGLSFFPWDSIQPQLEEVEGSYSWLSRPDAECSTVLVQAIPCAFIRDRGGNFYVLRQGKTTRKDLSKKLSLVVGGHVDEANERDTFLDLLSFNLLRELEEEILILDKESPRPVGVIIDHSSIEASRHVAFIHDVIAGAATPRASEEFTRVSKLHGDFMDTAKLKAKQNEFDPWSRLLIEEYICRGAVQKQPRQHLLI